MAKRKLHPALQANADRLKRGESLHQGRKPQKPKIRSPKSPKSK